MKLGEDRKAGKEGKRGGKEREREGRERVEQNLEKRGRERGRSWAKLGEKVIASSFRKENSFCKKERKKIEIDIRKKWKRERKER